MSASGREGAGLVMNKLLVSLAGGLDKNTVEVITGEMQDYTPIELFEEERYGLEQHTASGRYCQSIAVCTPWVEYLEHYELTPEEFEKVSADATARLVLVAKCRRKGNDDRLFVPPPPSAPPCP